jgi:hypothetical protein
MNERIKELAVQAKVEHCVSHVRLQEFAELIVKECIDILPEKVKIDDLYDGKILVQCGMAIKEHFGVEK